MCILAAATTVAADAWFSAQEGYLSRPPDYDGAGYMVFARSAYELLLSGHLHQALTHLLPVALGWNTVLAVQFLVLGPGELQAFSTRFWGVALLLLLVYWVVRNRAGRPMAIAAALLTAVLPMIDAGVRSSSWEYLSGRADHYENWGLDDLRPEILAIALVLWSVAVLAETSRAATRTTYLVSGLFAAAGVLVKPSTSPLILLTWSVAVAVVWWRNRKHAGALRDALLAPLLVAILLAPWAVVARGVQGVFDYLYETAVTYRGAYGTADSLWDRLAYYAGRVPTDLGQVEILVVAPAVVLVTIALIARRLALAEAMYAAMALAFFVVFALPPARNSHLAEWISMATWIYVWAGIARLAASPAWASGLRRLGPVLVAAVGAWLVVLFALGGVAIVAWPVNERDSNRQLAAVTSSLTDELRRHVSPDQCFAFAPGPGWPASIQFHLMDANGRYPLSTATDIDTTLTTEQYVDTARRCAAVISYREDIAEVARAFYAPAVYQPYLRGVAEWVRAPDSGFTLDRSWSFHDLAPFGPHQLGGYEGVSLTVDLFVRSG